VTVKSKCAFQTLTNFTPERTVSTAENIAPPVYQIEQNNLGLDAMLGDAHEERTEKVLGSHISQSQERNGNPADGQIRTACTIPAEVGEQSTHEI
jgi:hypothetical protein